MAALSESSGLQDDARLTNSYIPFHPNTCTPLGLLHIFVDSIEKKNFSGDSLYDGPLASFLLTTSRYLLYLKTMSYSLRQFSPREVIAAG
jgi:hypothetical protein